MSKRDSVALLFGLLFLLASACMREDLSRPPCDAATVAAITTRCSVAVTECPRDLSKPCAVYDACMRELDERQAQCLAR